MSTSAGNLGTSGLAFPVPKPLRVSQLLIALILLCSSFAFIDGLTTRYNDDWEYVANDALTYKAPTAAILFAIISLPLVLQFTRQQQVSRQEGLVLWYLLGVCAYTKDFAYLKIPGIPLYVTDYLLGFLLLRHFVWPKFRWYSLRSWPMLSAAALLCVGFIAVVRGLLGGQSPLLVLRDFGLVAYVLFLPVGILTFKNWESIRRVLLFLALGSAILSMYAIGLELSNPGQRRYVYYPVVLAGGFVASFAGLQNHIFTRKLGWYLTAINGFGLLLANSRAEFVAVLGTCGLMFFFGPSVGHSSMIHRIKLLAKLASIAIVLFAVLLQTRAGTALADRVVDEFLSGVLNPSEDVTAQFRFLAWAEAFSRFQQQPILGEGYGIPFTFADYDTDPRPHNTYLTFLYKTGATGFGVLVGVLGIFFFKAFRTSRSKRDDQHSAMPYIIALALTAISASGFFTLVFESPFISAPYWLLVAVGYRSLHLLGSKVSFGQPG